MTTTTASAAPAGWDTPLAACQNSPAVLQRILTVLSGHLTPARPAVQERTYDLLEEVMGQHAALRPARIPAVTGELLPVLADLLQTRHTLYARHPGLHTTRTLMHAQNVLAERQSAQPTLPGLRRLAHMIHTLIELTDSTP
ncbi:hypothetical protein [Streptomyces roseifaciens]|uniref:hypothetical protein n=1 Tax=Streptomyces roseifaciens TaxID=1488406 RepID=UPI000717F7FB|nr:hypothetical protein [Streptomyces roseifaciens]